MQRLQRGAQCISKYGPVHGQMAGGQGLASIARSKAVYSAIDSYALGGLKTGGVSANSTGRQTEV